MSLQAQEQRAEQRVKCVVKNCMNDACCSFELWHRADFEKVIPLCEIHYQELKSQILERAETR